ncbi:hypothetical protein EYF80_040971 [Liparis tanakae]|uniref:Uncharacterized protein n=1 Tax=Liparis tanakae TaxID=230148 RepID=A0A4Z2G5I7_9TELE|nr:hypothetical protein EYF80_040971 [Liparis tanakae]
MVSKNTSGEEKQEKVEKKTTGEVLQQGSVIACDVPTPVYHRAARPRASRRGFITARIQATSTSAEWDSTQRNMILNSFISGVP